MPRSIPPSRLAQSRLPHLKGLTNAVLRRSTRGRGDAGRPRPGRLNTPHWLWESWVATYGEETTRAIAAAHLIEAPLDLTPRSDADFWAGQLDAEMLPTGTLRRRAGGAIGELPGFAEGAWWVQDAAATLPARLLGDVAGQARRRPLRRTRRQDPAALRSRRAGDGGRHLGPPHGRLSDNLARAGMTAELVTADAGKWTPAEKFDAVLLDAPCSGTGTLRRHPDIAWLKDERRRRAASRSRRTACWCMRSTC